MFATIAAILLNQTAVAGSYQEIQQLICERKADDARTLALAKAKAGDAEGFIALGWFEEIGSFAQADATRAFAYYSAAANLGSAHAQWKVGVMLDTGLGVKQDSKTAVGWFKKSARQKLGAAWSSLGLMQLQGRGIPKDVAAARKSYRNAIRYGEPHGFAGIGAIIATGVDDMSAEYLSAIAWYQVAAEKGSDVAKEKLQRLPAMNANQWEKINKQAEEIARQNPITVIPFNRPCRAMD